jgi:hypothetical protein
MFFCVFCVLLCFPSTFILLCFFSVVSTVPASVPAAPLMTSDPSVGTLGSSFCFGHVFLLLDPRFPISLSFFFCHAQAGRKQVPFVCNTVCCLVPLHRCCCIDAMSVSHTQHDTPQPRPTCETLPTGLSLLEGEGWPSQAMRREEGLRRDVASHCARAHEAHRRVAANCHTQHAVKSCVPRRAVSSRLPMPPPARVYP